MSQKNGRCQCGQVSYTLDGAPLMTYACHCSDCQKRTGSAFSEGMLVLESDLMLAGNLSTWTRTGSSGAAKTRHSCADCGNVMYGTADNMPGMLLLQPGTLDSPAEVKPQAHIWTRSAQSWLRIPPEVPQWETQPEDMTEVLQAAQAYGAGD